MSETNNHDFANHAVLAEESAIMQLREDLRHVGLHGHKSANDEKRQAHIAERRSELAQKLFASASNDINGTGENATKETKRGVDSLVCLIREFEGDDVFKVAVDSLAKKAAKDEPEYVKDKLSVLGQKHSPIAKIILAGLEAQGQIKDPKGLGNSAH